jgi:SAM-dependent methyltransferase
MSEGNDQNKRRVERIVRKIRKLSEDKNRVALTALNIGIGNGLMERSLLTEGFQTYSLDPSENAVAMIARSLGVPEGRFKVGSCSSIPFADRQFDYVIMSEVIEHLDDQTLADLMQELKRVLKPGGCFIGTCPDSEDVQAKTNTCPHCGERFHRVGHVRRFTSQGLESLLKTHFNVEECYSFRGIDLNWKGVAMYWYGTLPYRIARLLRPSVTIPQTLGQHLFFVARA